MPVYVYKCEEGHQFDRILKMADYDKPQVCDCGAKAKRIIVPTMISCDIQPWDYYESPVTGKPITSYKQRKEDMARAGCVDYDPGIRKDSKKRLDRQDAALEKKMDETVERTISEMPAAKKEKLARELESGATCEYGRH